MIEVARLVKEYINNFDKLFVIKITSEGVNIYSNDGDVAGRINDVSDAFLVGLIVAQVLNDDYLVDTYEINDYLIEVYRTENVLAILVEKGDYKSIVIYTQTFDRNPWVYTSTS